MIILRITSGLGNQMFQYAFYTFLKEKYKDETILADTYWFNNNHEGRKYELEAIFKGVEGSEFEITKAPLGQVVRLSGKLPNIFSGSLAKSFEKLRRYPNRLFKDTILKKREPYIIDQLNGNLSDESEDGEINTPFYDKVMNLDMANDYYIFGFFIEEKYYSKVIESVKKKLVFPELTEEHNIEYAKQIKSSNSVSLHVRRGDYLSDLYKDKFMTLGKDYYEKAVNYIKDNAGIISNDDAGNNDKARNFKFFIFSDDEEFVKKEFEWLDNKVIVTGNSGDISFRDMQLMSMCKHNIVANSTFSQWGALLNNNEGHITVYPKVYMKDHDNEIKKLPGWIRL